jgi:2-hydroxychromene-2-carboxylate isomerase
MPKTLDFIFDFASPNAYFAHKALGPMLERTGASATYIPCLLGGIFKATGNQAPFVAFANVKGKNEYNMLEIQRFIAKHGLTNFKMNSAFPLNTVMLQRGALIAEEDGRLAEYIEAGLSAMWEDNVKMDDKDVFADALTQRGFDGAAILERTQDAAIKAKLIANTEAAVARGAFGIPTFYVGDDMYFGKDRLGQVEDALMK